jgi:hypothetical protein
MSGQPEPTTCPECRSTIEQWAQYGEVITATCPGCGELVQLWLELEWQPDKGELKMTRFEAFNELMRAGVPGMHAAEFAYGLCDRLGKIENTPEFDIAIFMAIGYQRGQAPTWRDLQTEAGKQYHATQMDKIAADAKTTLEYFNGLRYAPGH